MKCHISSGSSMFVKVPNLGLPNIQRLVDIPQTDFPQFDLGQTLKVNLHHFLMVVLLLLVLLSEYFPLDIVFHIFVDLIDFPWL